MEKPSFQIRRVVEYRDFFKGEDPIDIRATLKCFSRNTLVRMAAILSLHYGNLSWPNDEKTLFSDSSRKYIPYLNKLFGAYYKRIGLNRGQKVEILTYRTSLEFWRQMFAIRSDEYTGVVKETEIELMLFKVILSINEKIMSFTESSNQFKLDELVFLNSFLTNDGNNYDFKTIIQPQIYYFYKLINFIPANVVLSKATEVLFQNWGIKSWQQYYTSLFVIAYETDRIIKRKEKGVHIITLDWIKNNNRFVSFSLIEHMCIEEDEYIAYNDEDVSRKELNVDYRRFRSKPFVKLKDGTGYVVINNQLVCERLFNSLFFDFSPHINGQKNSCGAFDYNKGFIEKVLFRDTFFNCLPSQCFSFPLRGDNAVPEKPKEPDFYARSKRGELIIVECKAIKMNGECRDDGDYTRLIEELHEKLVRKTRNLDPTRKELKGISEPIGVGQLINHIDTIEADTFQWDDNIPDEVIYYPLLVFEDIKMVQKGLLSMVNRWFCEDIRKEWKELSLSEIAYMPIMILSINTLFLYDQFLRKKGLINMINAFVKDNAEYDNNTGEYKLCAVADFDEWLRRFPFNKRRDMIKWHRELMDGQ